MRCETLLCLLKNTSVNYQILSQRPRAEVCVEARLHPLDQSRISLLSASSFTFSLVLSNHTAANRKFTEKLPKPARNVSPKLRSGLNQAQNSRYIGIPGSEEHVPYRWTLQDLRRMDLSWVFVGLYLRKRA